MFRLDKYSVEIIIDLENGIYLFDNESATGKTRLCKLLREYQVYGEKVASYTFNDKLLGIPIHEILVPDKYKVIMLDRYDLYEGYGKELINVCAENTIILIDCKDKFTVTNEEDLCSIKLEPSKIEVS